MLLKKLTLYNFRPFKGEHEITFSTDREKNVTLVMAENGAGKTTLAQAFQWVLYGKTEGFKNTSVLNSLAEEAMMRGTSENVKVELQLEHNGLNYNIIRTQCYKKDVNGMVKRETSNLEIINKQSDGQTNFNNPIKNPSLIANILPESLSKYFFFDGERIEKMAGEVSSGKSEEFKTAVQNLLGLTALIKAIEHLNPGSKDSVIGRYINQMDKEGDEETRTLREKIYTSIEKIEKNEKRIQEVEEGLIYYNNQIDKIKNEIASYADAEKAQKKLNQLNYETQREKEQKNNTVTALMNNFSKETTSYFSRKLIKDALTILKNTENIDKGIPAVRAETIKFLMDRKKCICGADLSDTTSEKVQNLMELLKYIPPQSLGTSINQFVIQSNGSIRRSSTYFENIKSQLSTIRGCIQTIENKELEIGDIDKSILRLSNSKIIDLKNKQIDYEKTIRDYNKELSDLKADNLYQQKEKEEAEAEINRLQLKIQKNQTLETQKRYAEAAYNIIKQTYDSKESKTRENLETEINKLFEQIYAGGMKIDIDEKYKINTSVNLFGDSTANIDSNTAKSYSIIFAFIVGVIKLAKEKVKDKNNDGVVTDEYPLVMDAPLSSFDQRRIKNICEVIPNIARQVIVFIKDTDGNIAKREMKDKIKIEYEVALKDKDVHVDSKITKVGEY